MTTIAEKLLERAASYEQKAAALRLAAAEMNGDLTDRKQAGAAAMLTAAMQLRAQQQTSVRRATKAPRKPKVSFKGRVERTAARPALLRAILTKAAGPLSSGEIQRYLAAQGDTVTTSRVGQVLHAMGARAVGKGHQSKWVLRDRPAAQKRKGTQTKAMTQARRARSAEILATLDTSEPRPLAVDAVRSAGGLIRRGYLRKKGDGWVRSAKEFHA